MAIDLVAALADLFRSHGVTPKFLGNTLWFPDQQLTCGVWTSVEQMGEGYQTVELDVQLDLGPDRSIVESVVGVGPDRESAIRNSFECFAISSFHVLLAAFFPETPCDHVNREEWIIGGARKKVTLSHATLRHRKPEELTQEPFQQFAEMVQRAPLPDGIHWMRLYVARASDLSITEVLFDNEPHAAFQEEAAAMAWPAAEEIYSVRVFLILQDG